MQNSTPTTPWSALESIEGLTASDATWRKYLGDCFQTFSAAFLQRALQPARFVPCPRECGCMHKVIQHGPDDLVGVCCCEDSDCNDLPLTPADFAVWELNWSKLGRALCRALDLDPRTAKLNLQHTRQIGSWSAGAIPVILTIQTEPGRFQSVVADLVARLPNPFILFAPSCKHLTVTSSELLAHARAGFFDLASHLRLTDPGSLHPRKPPGELFSAFTPQPKELDEDAARRAFALVRNLDTDKSMQSPSLLTVFRRYCIEELSASQIARKHGCSKPTVLRRLALIRDKIGVDPAQLRRLSPHIAKLENNLSDSRAARLHHKSFIEEGDDEEA